MYKSRQTDQSERANAGIHPRPLHRNRYSSTVRCKCQLRWRLHVSFMDQADGPNCHVPMHLPVNGYPVRIVENDDVIVLISVLDHFFKKCGFCGNCGHHEYFYIILIFYVTTFYVAIFHIMTFHVVIFYLVIFHVTILYVKLFHIMTLYVIIFRITSLQHFSHDFDMS